MKIKRRQFISKLLLGVLSLIVLDSFWLETYFIAWTEHNIADSELSYSFN